MNFSIHFVIEASSVSKSDSEVGDEASTSVDLSAMKFGMYFALYQSEHLMFRF